MVANACDKKRKPQSGGSCYNDETEVQQSTMSGAYPFRRYIHAYPGTLLTDLYFSLYLDYAFSSDEEGGEARQTKGKHARGGKGGEVE